MGKNDGVWGFILGGLAAGYVLTQLAEQDNQNSRIVLDGNISYSIETSAITIQIEKIVNKLSRQTQNLCVDLWATKHAYNGSDLQGYKIASIPLQQLQSGYQYNNIKKRVEYSKPPSGEYYMTLSLSEQDTNGNGRMCDYRTFKNKISIVKKSMPSIIFFLFGVLGGLAKADGEINQKVIETLTYILKAIQNSLQVEKDELRQILQVFDEAPSELNYRLFILHVFELHIKYVNVNDVYDKTFLFDAMFTVAMINGYSLKKEKMIDFIVDMLHLDQEAYATIKQRHQQPYSELLANLLAMLGKLAYIEGKPTVENIDYIKNCIKEVDELSSEEEAFFNVFINAGESLVSFEKYTQQLYSQIEDDRQSIAIINMMLRVVKDGGKNSPAKMKMVLLAVDILHVPYEMYEKIKDQYYPVYDKYYAVLECRPEDSIQEIKAKYKKLAMQYHPDKLQSKDLPEPFIKFATEKFQEIQEAYEKIKRLRKF